MNLVNILKTAISKNDWSLVTKALEMINGNEKSIIADDIPSHIVKQKVINKSKSLQPPTENKFVDDLTLETIFIEKNQSVSNKNYRKPFKETDHFYDVKCSRCNNTIKLTQEEYKFKTNDTESAPFTCIKCIRNSSR